MTSLLTASTLPHTSENKGSVSYSTLVRAAKNARNQSRAARNALYWHTQFINSLPEDAKAYHKENRQAQGLPRAYSIQFSDPTVDKDHPELQSLNGQTLLIGEHGSENTGIHFNGNDIDPQYTGFSAATNCYSFKSSLPIAAPPSIFENRVAASESVEASVGAFVNLAGEKPSGVLAIGDKSFNIHLDPVKTWFDVNVSADAGAYFSSGEQKLKWDTNSTAWKDAHWEEAGLTFGYGQKDIGNALQHHVVAENTFIDNSTSPPTEFDLPATAYSSKYTSIVGTSDAMGSLMLTQVTTSPPPVPAGRAAKPVRSVFPALWQVQFTPFAGSFVGAYRDVEGNVYAVSGSSKVNDEISLATVLSGDATGFPVQNLNQAVAVAPPEAPKPARAPVTALPAELTTGAPTLQVIELLTLNPMVQDSADPSGWRDSVAQLAMQDFHDLIVYFMDEDLRKTFVQAAAPALTDKVLAVANDDVASNPSQNKTFYQKLQVPYIVSLLAAGTGDQGKYCNGKRADAQLKDIPSEDPVYKRHSGKLYRARYIEKFPSTTKFTKDQNDYEKQDYYMKRIDAFATYMKQNIADRSADLQDGNPNYKENLATAQGDIDGLADWAKERSLYWAMELLFYVQKSAIPNWYLQYASGANTNSLSMMQKQLNALFGILENNRTNTKKDGRNFMQAYNDQMRLFQMTSIIPSLIDTRGNSVVMDTLIADCLNEYIENFKASPDQNHMDAVKAAQELALNKNLRDNFWIPMTNLSRVGGAAASWTLTMTMWGNHIQGAEWFGAMNNGAKVLAAFQAAASAALIIMPLLPGMWDHMTQGQKATWYLSLAGLFGLLFLRFAKGLVSFYHLWNDIASISDSIKCIAGCESVIDAIPNAAARFESNWAKLFTRTSKQTVAMQELLQAEVVGGNEAAQFSNFERMIGRNMGEVIGTIAGLALAAVSIVMTAIDLATQTDGALIAMDIVMIISSVIQILAVVAGWVVIAGTTAAAGTWLATLASYSAITLLATWGGPAAIVFAVIGIVIFAIWWYFQDHRDPIEKFLDEKAGPAGLRMPGEKQAPEYFGIVPADTANPSLIGLSIQGPLVSTTTYQTRVSPIMTPGQLPAYKSATLKLSDSQLQFISLGTSGQDALPTTVGAVDYSLNTVWSLETDPWGKSMIYTAKYTEKADKTYERAVWYLGTSEDNTQVVLRQLPRKSDKAKRDAVLPHVQWTVDILTQPTQDKPDVKNDKGLVTKLGNVLSAIVGISQNNAKLGRWVDRKTLKIDDGLALATDANAFKGSQSFPDKMLCATWTMSMAPIGPSEFKYSQQQWNLYDSDTDKRIIPRFTQLNTISEGLRWSIHPPLPAGVFELVTSGGQDEGMIRQVESKKPPEMAATTYTVSCSLLVSGNPVGTRTTQVVIKVEQDPDA